MNASPQPAAQYETIDLRVDGPIATLELARPDSLNALSGLMLTEIEAAAVAMDDLPEVKVVVVRGQGRAFCAGADVSGFRGEVTRRERDQGWRTARALEQMSAVTVARIHGWCVGGGAVLFCIGVYGVIARRNAVLVLMSIELILNSVNINLLAFALRHGADIAGHTFALYVIAIAAAEVGVGLAIVLLIYRNRRSIALDELSTMKG